MRQFRWLVLLIVAVSLLLPIVWGTPRVTEGQSGGDTWRNVIFDFQTLIAGALAVFAAWWTVDTMEKTDQQAEKRHLQMLEATIFRDKILLERARSYAKMRATFTIEICRRLTPEHLEKQEKKGRQALVILMAGVWTTIKQMEECFQAEEWVRAAYLVTPQVARICALVEANCSQFLWFSPDRPDIFDKSLMPTRDQLDWIIGENPEGMIQICSALLQELDNWKIA